MVDVGLDEALLGRDERQLLRRHRPAVRADEEKRRRAVDVRGDGVELRGELGEAAALLRAVGEAREREDACAGEGVNSWCEGR